jgi:hypothetical protein
MLIGSLLLHTKHMISSSCFGVIATPVIISLAKRANLLMAAVFLKVSFAASSIYGFDWSIIMRISSESNYSIRVIWIIGDLLVDFQAALSFALAIIVEHQSILQMLQDFKQVWPLRPGQQLSSRSISPDVHVLRKLFTLLVLYFI